MIKQYNLYFDSKTAYFLKKFFNGTFMGFEKRIRCSCNPFCECIHNGITKYFVTNQEAEVLLLDKGKALNRPDIEIDD